MLVITSKKTKSIVIMTQALNQHPPQKKKKRGNYPEQNDPCFIILEKRITISHRKLHLCHLLHYLFLIPNLFLDYYYLEAYAREQTQIVQKIAAEHNGSDFVFAEDPEAKKELWKVVVTQLMFSEWHFVLSLSSC